MPAEGHVYLQNNPLQLEAVADTGNVDRQNTKANLAGDTECQAGELQLTVAQNNAETYKLSHERTIEPGSPGEQNLRQTGAQVRDRVQKSAVPTLVNKLGGDKVRQGRITDYCNFTRTVAIRTSGPDITDSAD